MIRAKTALIDLDSIIHIVAPVQFKAGNRDNPMITEAHVKRFVNSVVVNSGCQFAIMFYQDMNHQNFRNTILPEYKKHRVPSEAVLLWKPVIIKVFKDIRAQALKYIESDDAIFLYSEIFGKDCVIVSGDKDMFQIPGTHYNPYKRNLTPEQRWKTVTRSEAEKFFWIQVLCGDSTDMPNNMCGIEGVGPATALKLLDQADVETPYSKVIQQAYTKKYGSKEGFIRANRTYKMVKLLSKYGSEYINDNAKQEMKTLLFEEDHITIPIEDDDISSMFDLPNSENLFNS